MDTQAHHKTTKQDDGSLLVELPGKKITILPDADMQAFSRNGIKLATKEHSRWLVCQLDGVRLYVNGDNMVLTKQDLFP
jgi:NOL1/NOP2/fmu family ribosome biogenesis protein